MLKSIEAIRESRKFSESLYILFLSLICCGLLSMRQFYTDSRYYAFLGWNLFLAFIPWIITTVLYIIPALKRSRMMMFLLLCVWLLFFPNAPYILTDLFHLSGRNDAPIWYDLLMLLSFALTGMLLGLMSLWDVEDMLRQVMNKAVLAALVSLLLFVCAFGIYLGRYLRWNSWDIISSPIGLAKDIAKRILRPEEYPGAWGMTLLYGGFLNVAYISFRKTRKKRIPEENYGG